MKNYNWLFIILQIIILFLCAPSTAQSGNLAKGKVIYKIKIQKKESKPSPNRELFNRADTLMTKREYQLLFNNQQSFYTEILFSTHFVLLKLKLLIISYLYNFLY